MRVSVEAMSSASRLALPRTPLKAATSRAFVFSRGGVLGKVIRQFCLSAMQHFGNLSIPDRLVAASYRCVYSSNSVYNDLSACLAVQDVLLGNLFAASSSSVRVQK